MTDTENLYRMVYLIRRFEETVLENFPRAVFYGTTHTYIGQEANAVGVLSQINDQDIAFSNHRCHGHFLAYGGSPHALFAELMGRTTGVCAGRGGSQHLHWRNFYSNGVLGGIVPIATGMALAEKFKNTGAVAIAFLGDGTLGEGVFYEALNLAALWNAPILFVLENNQIAQTTPIELAVAGEITLRFRTFDIPVEELDTSDVKEILPIAGHMLANVRTKSAPHALILNTVRFGPHSKGDDTRDPRYITELRKERDPVQLLGKYLEQETREEIELAVEQEISDAYKKAIEDPLPDGNRS